jgi:hypothetical protein
MTQPAQSSGHKWCTMLGRDAMGNGNDHFGVHKENNFCAQRGCKPLSPTDGNRDEDDLPTYNQLRWEI